MRSGFTSEKNDWNINRKFVDTFNILLASVNEAIATGNIGLSYNYLWVLYSNMRGHQRVPVQWRQLIHTQLLALSSKIRNLSKLNVAQIQKQMDEYDARNEVLEIHGKIMDMLYESKMINMHLERDTRVEVYKTT